MATDNTVEQPIHRDDLLASLPLPWPDDLLPEIRRDVRATGRKVVVLDDDPTGTQTVHDLWVLTEWSTEALRTALSDEGPLFYILTNSRSLSQAEAVALDREIARNLASVAGELGCELDIISRSDSTLRGHFPAETDALQMVLEPSLGCAYDGVLVCPFFFEGGRLTVWDVHWVTDGDYLIPAAQTEYARDATFGYTHSNLKAWVEEKTLGRVPASEVVSVSLDVIRRQGPEGVRRLLRRVSGGGVGIVNAVSYRDIEVFVSGLLAAEADGMRFLFRTAASFVKVRGGVTDRALLAWAEMVGPRTAGGLIVVGSYVDKTTRQLVRAMQLPQLTAIELSVRDVLVPAVRGAAIERVRRAVNAALDAGLDALVYTSRDLVTKHGRAGELDIGRQVSKALVSVVCKLDVTPHFVIAKGGITSSDVATDGLGVERAWVLGQIAPGVPVWRLGQESRFPGLCYVVFPGNVGDDDTLARAIRVLRGEGRSLAAREV